MNTYNVPKNKITVGIGFYGRSAKTNSAPALHGPSAGIVDNITFDVDAGMPLYYSVLSKLNLFNELWDNTAKVPYLTGKNGLNTFLSYDNEASIELKAQHIVEQDLRGAIIWEITGDYIETAEGSGLIAHTPLVNKLNDVFCNYIPGGSNANLIEKDKIQVSIYPNPASNKFFISSDINDACTVTIIDIQGKTVVRVHQESPNKGIDISSLETGIYHVHISFASGEAGRANLVKLH